MIQEPITAETVLPEPWREGGAAVGREYGATKPHGGRRKAPPNRRRRVEELIARAAAGFGGENAAWVLDNFRLILTTEREVREFAAGLRNFPVLLDSRGEEIP